MFKEIIKSIKKDIVGNDQNIKISLAAILSGGHILIEDLPELKNYFCKIYYRCT